MKDQKNQFRIELTPDQKDQVRHATGKDAEAVELSVEELEERIAPVKLKPQAAEVILGGPSQGTGLGPRRRPVRTSTGPDPAVWCIWFSRYSLERPHKSRSHA